MPAHITLRGPRRRRQPILRLLLAAMLALGLTLAIRLLGATALAIGLFLALGLIFFALLAIAPDAIAHLRGHT